LAGGPKRCAQLKQEAKQYRISDGQLYAARDRLNIQTWLGRWYLPQGRS